MDEEPLLAQPDEPPPVPVMLAEPAQMAAVTLEGSDPTYPEYPEAGQDSTHTGGVIHHQGKPLDDTQHLSLS